MVVVGQGSEGGRPREFGISLTTMIPKVDAAFEGDAATCMVPSVRPLACGNTDTKIYGLAVNRPLNIACASCLSEVQRGFISGRSMAERVLLYETAMSGMSKVSCEVAAVFLDFAAPFPSLLHDWLFRVLTAARVPIEVVRMLRFLYIDQASYFSMGRRGRRGDSHRPRGETGMSDQRLPVRHSC